MIWRLVVKVRVTLVETSDWIDYFRGVESKETDLLDELLEIDRLVIGDLILAELKQGCQSEKELKIINEVVGLLDYRDLVGRRIADKAAENYQFLRQKGVTVRKTIDVIIGTFCIEHDLFLLHSDRDFDPMENYLELKVRR
ncbi:MAG: PIN domain nuclease [Bacteroidota bacterium]